MSGHTCVDRGMSGHTCGGRQAEVGLLLWGLWEAAMVIEPVNKESIFIKCFFQIWIFPKSYIKYFSEMEIRIRKENTEVFIEKNDFE